MCTLSLLRLRQRYSLMMNRDEDPLRPPATARLTASAATTTFAVPSTANL